MLEACTCAKCMEIYKQGCADDECGIETQSAWAKRMAHAREQHEARVMALEWVAKTALHLKNKCNKVTAEWRHQRTVTNASAMAQMYDAQIDVEEALERLSHNAPVKESSDG